MFVIIRHQLGRAKGQILGWGLCLAVYAGYMVRFYEEFLGMQDQFMQLLKSYPEELVAVVGGIDALATPAGYLHTYVFSYMPLILGVFAVLAGTGLLVQDEERGILDLIISHPLSRLQLFLGRWIGLNLTLGLILLLMWIGVAIPLGSSQMGFSIWSVMGGMVSLVALLLLFSGLGLLLSMLLPSRNLASAVTGFCLMASFLVTTVAGINPDIEGLGRISPFQYYQGGLALEGVDWTWVAGLVGIAMLFSLLGWILFSRRDIRVAGESSWRLSSILSTLRNGV